MGPNSPGAKAAPKSFKPAQDTGAIGTPHPPPQHNVVPPAQDPQSTAHHHRVQALINKPQGGSGRDKSRD